MNSSNCPTTINRSETFTWKLVLKDSIEKFILLSQRIEFFNQNLLQLQFCNLEHFSGFSSKGNGTSILVDIFSNFSFRRSFLGRTRKKSLDFQFAKVLWKAINTNSRSLKVKLIGLNTFVQSDRSRQVIWNIYRQVIWNISTHHILSKEIQLVTLQFVNFLS